MFWTWNSPDFRLFPNSCWLKSSDAGRKPVSGKVSGPKYCNNNNSEKQLSSNDAIGKDAESTPTNNEDYKQDYEYYYIDENDEDNKVDDTNIPVDNKEEVSSCFEENVNFAGFGLPDNKLIGTLSPNDCQKQCQERDGCQFWTLVKTTCWLKSSNKGRKSQVGKISGPKYCDGFQEESNQDKSIILTEDDKDVTKLDQPRTDVSGISSSSCFLSDVSYQGFGIPDNKISDITSAASCQQLCLERDDCQYWTWNGPQFRAKPNTCFLKSSNQNQVASKGKTSGPKICRQGRQQRDIDGSDECYETDVIYAGNGIPNNRVDEVLNPEACQAECNVRVGCFFWTWNSEKSARFPNTCWLKSRTGDQNKKTAENKISGPRSCQDPYAPELALGIQDYIVFNYDFKNFQCICRIQSGHY